MIGVFSHVPSRRVPSRVTKQGTQGHVAGCSEDAHVQAIGEPTWTLLLAVAVGHRRSEDAHARSNDDLAAREPQVIERGQDKIGHVGFDVLLVGHVVGIHEIDGEFSVDRHGGKDVIASQETSAKAEIE